MPAESQLFTIRLWPEEAGSADPRWRGQVRHVPSGAWRYFRDWETLCDFLEISLRHHAGADPVDNAPEPKKE